MSAQNEPINWTDGDFHTMLVCSTYLIKQSCSALTSVTSALEVIFNVMRSINPRFTYLLTYYGQAAFSCRPIASRCLSAGKLSLSCTVACPILPLCRKSTHSASHRDALSADSQDGSVHRADVYLVTTFIYGEYISFLVNFHRNVATHVNYTHSVKIMT